MPEPARQPGGINLVDGRGDVRGPVAPSPGKRTLTEQLPNAGRAAPKAAGAGTGSRNASTTQDWSDAAGALGAAADIVSNRRSRESGGLHSTYVPTLWKLYAAISGIERGRPLAAAERNARFQEARRELARAIELYASSPDGKTWLEDYFSPGFTAAISSLAFGDAKERVHNAVLVDSEHVLEIPPDGEPRE